MADCKGKRRYETLADAQRALNLGQSTWHYPPVRWYRCPECGAYHLTAKAEQPEGDLEAQERAFTENRENRERARRRYANPFAVLTDPPEDD